MPPLFLQENNHSTSSDQSLTLHHNCNLLAFLNMIQAYDHNLPNNLHTFNYSSTFWLFWQNLTKSGNLQTCATALVWRPISFFLWGFRSGNKLDIFSPIHYLQHCLSVIFMALSVSPFSNPKTFWRNMIFCKKCRKLKTASVKVKISLNFHV